MEFLKKIKQFLGIGTVKVKLQVEKEFKRSANSLSGEILLSAKSAQEVIELTVELEEEWKIGRDENETTKTFNLGSWSDKSTFTMNPGEEKRVPFTLKYELVKSKNDEMRDTAGKVGKTLGGLGKLMDGERSTYNITATADVKGAAFDPNCVVTLKLVD